MMIALFVFAIPLEFLLMSPGRGKGGIMVCQGILICHLVGISNDLLHTSVIVDSIQVGLQKHYF